MAKIKKDGNFMGLPMNIARGNPIPLDKSEIWYSYEEMSSYAKTSPVAYVGQILGLVDEDNQTASAYIILNQAGDLQEIGSNITIPSIQGDNKSIEIQNDLVALKNWGKKYYKFISATDTEAAHFELQIVDEENPWIEGLEPKVVKEDGDLVLAWYEPNLSTAEGVNDQITALQGAVNTLTQNTYTKTEVDKKIAAAGHLKRIIINSLDDININAPDADQYIYMILSSPEDEADKYNEYMVIVLNDNEGEETRFIERVGSWKVDLSNYVTNTYFTENLNKKVDIQQGYSLVQDSEIAKLLNIEAGAQKNYISSVNEVNFTVNNGQLELAKIQINKIENLENILNKKIDAEEGKGLSTNDFTDEHLQNLSNNIENFQILNTKVIALEKVLNDTTDEYGNEKLGLISAVQSHDFSIGVLNAQVSENTEDIKLLLDKITVEPGPSIDIDNFITKEIFYTAVGSAEELSQNSQTLNSQVQEIKEAITWSEL